MLSKKNLQILKKILYKYFDKSEIFIFGSRVKNNFKKYSDIDILIKGKKEIDFSVLTKVGMELDESDLPIMVDIVDFHNITKSFFEQIQDSLISIENLSISL